MLLPKEFRPNLINIKDSKLLNEMSSSEKPNYERKLHCRMYNLSKEGWQRIVTAKLSVRKKYLDKIGGFSKDFVFWGFEDVDLGYRLSKTFKLKFIWDDKIKVYHLYHSREAGNMSNDLLVFN